jgi:hypothetical protein
LEALKSKWVAQFRQELVKLGSYSHDVRTGHRRVYPPQLRSASSSTAVSFNVSEAWVNEPFPEVVGGGDAYEERLMGIVYSLSNMLGRKMKKQKKI